MERAIAQSTDQSSIPHLKPGFFGRLKVVFQFQNDALGLFDDLASRGDIVLMEVWGIKQYVMFHPDMYHEIMVEKVGSFHKDAQYTSAKKGLAFFLGQGLLTTDGDFWRRQRRLASPAFHTRRIEAYAGVMVEDTLRMLETWRSGQTLDIDDQMMRLTLGIVARTLFNTDMTDDARTIGDALTILQQMFSEADLMPTWWPRRKQGLRRRAVESMNEVVYRMIRERHKAGDPDYGDLLSMLMLAEDEDGHRMSDQQLRDEAVTIMLAGHETTANALNWTWVLLSQHPQIEARLHAELDSVLNGAPPTLADLKRLPYTEMVIKESMRLYPPAYGLSRVAIEDVTIGGHVIPARSIVNVLPYNVQRDPRWWDDPLTFNPERWASGDEPRHKFAYLPFGAGQRICIGQSFAMMEACLLLATIAQRYQLRVAPGKRIVPEPLITLRPKGGLQMQLIEREAVRVLA
jgi:cytochrome P450